MVAAWTRSLRLGVHVHVWPVRPRHLHQLGGPLLCAGYSQPSDKCSYNPLRSSFSSHRLRIGLRRTAIHWYPSKHATIRVLFFGVGYFTTDQEPHRTQSFHSTFWGAKSKREPKTRQFLLEATTVSPEPQALNRLIPKP